MKANPTPPPSPADADLSGRRLGDFQLIRRLGRGAMAEVYLAEQERLKRRVAVKVLRRELAGDGVYLKRFELEAQAAASLIHTNIVQIYEVGCVEDLHYIAQEYVQGKNLRDYVTRHGPPDLSHALSIMRQAAAALAKAAEQGVIHRDIKPENIMLTAGGEVKIADFGLARFTGNHAATDLTQIGITLGTPLYMSPEQVEGKTLDPRSDLYSLGVTCYHMLTGSPPFAGETALAVAVQHLKSRPRPLESLRPDLPASLCRIVHQMLVKEPSQRLASARELLRELRRVQLEHFGGDWPDDLPAWEPLAAEMPADSQAVVTRQLDGLMKSAAQLQVIRRRRRWVVLGLIGTAVAVGAAARWATTPRWLLADARAAAPAIPKKSTVLQQWYLASQQGTEEAWQSVIDYFPEKQNRYIASRAREQLALVYVHNLELDRAMAIFTHLANGDDGEAELRAFGLAGQCVVLSLREQYRESDAALRQLLPIQDKLPRESPMRRLLASAIKKNRSKLGPQTAREWEKWLEEQFPEGA
ncbi:MAG: serine/threonine-protein kinase [Thermoguttaceae bacterium]